MSEPVAGEQPGVDEVVDLLEAYAEARLTPTSPVLARMRAHLMAEAAMRAAIAASEREAAISNSRRARGVLAWRIPRRVVAAGLAATLTFGTAAAVLAAPPGSPFYPARVQLEQIFLPAQPDDRVAAIERHLQDRLAEAQAAADRGDVAALQAALDAYRAEVSAAVAEVGFDAALLAHLEEELGRHTAVLQALAAQLPDQASIEHAIEASQKAAKKLRDTGKPDLGGQPAPHATAPGGPPTQH
jgi:hypothetical protein